MPLPRCNVAKELSREILGFAGAGVPVSVIPYVEHVHYKCGGHARGQAAHLSCPAMSLQPDARANAAPELPQKESD